MASQNARSGKAGSPRGTCPSIIVLEEYAATRLHGRDVPSITEHLTGCSRCRGRVARLAADAEALRDSLTAVASGPASPCPSAETLAAYIDQAVELRERRKIEEHIAMCRPCQEKLRDICRETNNSVSEDAEPYGASPPVRLADKKRTKRSVAKRPPKPASRDSADEKQRKKRLSSDSS